MAAKTGYKHKSPGPKYLLPTTIGPDCKDPTVRSQPGWILGTAVKPSRKPFGPGPKYDTSGYNQKGKVFSPAFFFGTKPSQRSMRNITPSPQKYEAHLCPDTRHVRPPAWEIGNPYRHTLRKSSPAPKYLLPQVTGGTPPDLPNVPAYSILGRDALKYKKSFSPGPGRYRTIEPELYLTRAPSPAILSKRRVSTLYSQTIPGPKYSSKFNWKVEPPSYTFGVKHSMYEVISYTSEDKQPFYGM